MSNYKVEIEKNFAKFHRSISLIVQLDYILSAVLDVEKTENKLSNMIL